MLYIPMMNHGSTAETRAEYLNELKRAGADRVFLALTNYYGKEPEQSHEIELLKENLEYYTAQGFECAVWINGLGHGGNLEHESHNKTASYTHIRGLSDAGEADDSFCPLDPDFVKMYTALVRRIAAAGTKILMIDDDLRMSMHGACKIGCACPLHIKEFNKRAGTDFKRKDLYDKLFTCKPNALRNIWLELQADTMRDFCRAIRAAADEVNPAMRIGQCACLTTWDVDGADSFEISRILAGNTEPFLRGISAPYWLNSKSFKVQTLGNIIDNERMELAWREKYAPDIKEMFTEGDLYPRPRYKTPFMYVEDFDQVLRAECKADAILKYMLTYSYKPDYETGYIDRHVLYKPLRDAIDKEFAGKSTAGVYIHEVMHKIHDTDLTDYTEEQLLYSFSPNSIQLSSAVSLPTSFSRTPYTSAALVFGENARYMDKDTEGLPLILDALAAEMLTQNGIDVGLLESRQIDTPVRECYNDCGMTLSLCANGKFRTFTLSPAAKVLSTFDTGAPAAYLYENAAGLRVLVYAFEAEKTELFSDMTRSYPRQKQLFRAIEWLTGKPLPVRVYEQPALYPLACKDDTSMTVGLWNFYDDIALPKYIELDKPYSDIRFIGEIGGRLDGNKVYLDKGIMPYGFASFTVVE